MTRRTPLSGLLAVVLVTTASAAIWESPGWALSSDVEGKLGYDSNLDFANGGASSGYATLEPSLTLVRRNSATQLELSTDLVHTQFENSDLASETYGRIGFKYAYPYTPEARPSRTIYGSWGRVTTANPYLARRVDIDTITLGGSFKTYDRGKFSLYIDPLYRRTKYDLVELHTDEEYGGIFSFRFEKSPDLYYSVNFRPSHAKSTPNNGVPPSTKSNHLSLNGRADGVLLPKVKGYAFLGGTSGSYSGAYDGTRTMLNFGAGLVWDVTSSGDFDLSAERTAGFSPRGDVTERTNLNLVYTQVFFSFWKLSLSTGVEREDYPSILSGRRDDSYSLGGDLSYQVSNRFSMDLSYSYSSQTSDLPLSTYNRHSVEVGAKYHF